MSISIKNAKDMPKSNYPDEQLMLEQQRLQNEERKVNIENFKLRKLESKIEHARRNIEVMIRLGEALANTTDKECRNLITEVVVLNLNILKETANIK